MENTPKELAMDTDKLILHRSSLKDKVISICEELSKFGEESAFLSVNTESELAFSTGSVIGRSFLCRHQEMMDLFYKYCRFRYTCPDNSKLLEGNELKQEVKSEDSSDVVMLSEISETVKPPPVGEQNTRQIYINRDHTSDSVNGKEYDNSSARTPSNESFRKENIECDINSIDYQTNDVSSSMSNVPKCDVVDIPLQNTKVERRKGRKKRQPSSARTPSNKFFRKENVECDINSIDHQTNDVSTSMSNVPKCDIVDIPLQNTKVERRKERKKRQPFNRRKNETKCSECAMHFYHISKLKAHMKTHNDSESFSCRFCNIKIFNAESFRIHMKLHNSSGKDVFKNSDSIQKMSLSDEQRCVDDCGDKLKIQKDKQKYKNFIDEGLQNNADSLEKGKVIFTKFVQMTAAELGFPSKSQTSMKDRNLGSMSSPDKISHSGQRFDKTHLIKNSKHDNSSDTAASQDLTKPSKKQFYCDICCQFFVGIRAFSVHQKCHMGKNVFTCDICGKLLSSKLSLDKHINLHSGKDIYKCDVCGKKYNWVGNLKIHMRKHTGDRPHSCPNCFERFDTKASLNLHWKKTCGNVHIVDSASSSVLLPNIPNRGRKRKSNIGETITEDNMNRKMLSEDDKETNHGRVTKTLDPSYRSVMDIVKNLQKNNVQNSGGNYHAIKNEVTVISDDDEDDDDCEDQNNDVKNGEDDNDDEISELLTSNRLNNVSSNDKVNQKCSTSPKTSEQLDTLFKCDVCGKAFIDRSSLAIHNQKHITEKVYKCEVCGKGFIHENNLNLHRKIHTS